MGSIEIQFVFLFSKTLRQQENRLFNDPTPFFFFLRKCLLIVTRRFCGEKVWVEKSGKSGGLLPS